jgi:hypothetical protein
MTLYLFTLQPEDFKELDLPEGQNYADFNCLRWSGDSKLADWKTPELVWFTNEFSQGDEQDGDFLKFRGGAPVITEGVKNLLSPLLQQSAEFLPVKIANETRYILNVTCVLNIMDKSKSKFKIYGDGSIGPCQHAYLKTPEELSLMFKVDGFLPRIFVSEKLQQLINTQQFSGCLLRAYINP